MSKGQKQRTAISPTREENYAEWYQQVIKMADLSENSPVRGCMVIKPYGYAIWENIQKILDAQFKETGHENVYFPLFIPLKFFQKEAQHVEGFATECAVVTHHRLEKNTEGELVPASPLEEPLVVRPTSEMIIGEAFSRWIQSYRDLPVLVNQWANVVRWEMRTRMFLRTTEFLWQEGHTAHATQEEAMEETLKMLKIYDWFCHTILAIPVIRGEKSENERFPGAVATYCIEAMMQDGKALQAGTSHYLGQNFAKAASIRFQNQEGVETYAFTTSWGVTTRLIGAMVMAHSDDDGLILPPKVAPYHVVIIPIIQQEEAKEIVQAYCQEIVTQLSNTNYHGEKIRIKVDRREERGGEKIWYWIKKGVPIRIEIGLKEVNEQVVSMAIRTAGHKEKQRIDLETLQEKIKESLEVVHQTLYKRAFDHRQRHTQFFSDREAFIQFFHSQDKTDQIEGGFAEIYWAGDSELENQLKKEYNITIRCLPFEHSHPKEGVCLFTGKKTDCIALFAKAY